MNTKPNAEAQYRDLTKKDFMEKGDEFLAPDSRLYKTIHPAFIGRPYSDMPPTFKYRRPVPPNPAPAASAPSLGDIAMAMCNGGLSESIALEANKVSPSPTDSEMLDAVERLKLEFEWRPVTGVWWNTTPGKQDLGDFQTLRAAITAAIASEKL